MSTLLLLTKSYPVCLPRVLFVIATINEIVDNTNEIKVISVTLVNVQQHEMI